MKKSHAQARVEETVSDFQENVSEFMENAKPIADRVVKKSKELYEEASSYLPENSRQIVGLTAAGLTIGLIGYGIGKSRNKQPLIEQASEASSQLSGQLAPVFKFLKLWMLYRLSV